MRYDRIIFLTALAGSLAAAGCSRSPSPGPAASTPPADKKLSIVRPEKRTVTQRVDQPGIVQAFEETALLAKVPGYVGSIADDPEKKDRPPHDRQIDIGSRVKAGQVLAELAVPELEQEWKQKKALVEQARAEVVQSEKALAASGSSVTLANEAVTEAEAGVERAQALFDRWQSEVERVAKLVRDGVDVSQTLAETTNQFKAAGATRKEAAARVASARAAVAKAQADREKAAADVDAAKARLDVAREAVGQVDALRGYTKIKAPFDGIVTARFASTGDFVTGSGKANLFTVARIDPVRVVVKVPEADAGVVEVGQEAKITLQSVDGPERIGKVVRTSWALEPGSRTLRAEVDLPNPDGLVRPGTYAYVKLAVVLPAAWAVPAAAVAKVSGQSVIYLVEGGKAVRVPVELLRGDAQFSQIRRYMKPGASQWTDMTGSESVASPAAGLTDGQPVP